MKTKHILFTIALFFSVAFINAQDKYEFMTMIYSGGSKEVSISINGTQFIREKVEIGEQSNSGYNTNGILSKITEYQNKEWEFLNMQLAYPGTSNLELYFAHLRKKIK